MQVNEWALVAFTILSQMSVGTFVVLGIVNTFARRKYGVKAADSLSDRALLAIGPVIILAFIASLFHLGNPFTAYRAVANLGTSWLSREILSGILFAIVGGLFALMQWRKIGSETLRTIIAWIAALIGLFFVYAMANVYMLETVPTWNTVFTPISFFTTTFLLGTLAVAAAYVASYAYIARKQPEDAENQSEHLRWALRGLALTSIVLLGVVFVVIPSNLAYQYTGPLAGILTIRDSVAEYGAVFFIRLVLVFIGAGLLAVALLRNTLSAGRESALSTLAYSAFALVLISEILGRFLFYSQFMRIGL
jgi:anaerobic dimethyl sulfoxide reductase subunit C (anchor subunit)